MKIKDQTYTAQTQPSRSYRDTKTPPVIWSEAKRSRKTRGAFALAFAFLAVIP
jgi:hypothetical protein